MNRVRRALRALLMLAALPATFSCAHRPVQSEGTANAATTQELAWPPRNTLKAVLETAAGGESINVGTIAARLSGVPHALLGDRRVMTVVTTEPYDCSSNFDGVPAEAWAVVCRNGGLLHRQTISGTPTVRQDDSSPEYLSGDVALEFYYYLDELTQDAATLSLPLRDLTSAYIREWRGHFPFPYTVGYLGREGDYLLVVTTESENFKLQTRRRVRGITIYKRL